MSGNIPTVGRIVVYRYPTGGLDVPAIVTATQETLAAADLDERHVRPLTTPGHLHLTAFTPVTTASHGTEHVRDVAQATDSGQPAPNSWRWPSRTEHPQSPREIAHEVAKSTGRP